MPDWYADYNGCHAERATVCYWLSLPTAALALCQLRTWNPPGHRGQSLSERVQCCIATYKFTRVAHVHKVFTHA